MHRESTTGVDIHGKSRKSNAIASRVADTKLVSSFEVVVKKGMSAPGTTWKEWKNEE